MDRVTPRRQAFGDEIAGLALFEASSGCAWIFRRISTNSGESVSIDWRRSATVAWVMGMLEEIEQLFSTRRSPASMTTIAAKRCINCNNRKSASETKQGRDDGRCTGPETGDVPAPDHRNRLGARCRRCARTGPVSGEPCRGEAGAGHGPDTARAARTGRGGHRCRPAAGIVCAAPAGPERYLRGGGQQSEERAARPRGTGLWRGLYRPGARAGAAGLPAQASRCHIQHPGSGHGGNGPLHSRGPGSYRLCFPAAERRAAALALFTSGAHSGACAQGPSAGAQATAVDNWRTWRRIRARR